MKISIAFDHGGAALRAGVVEFLLEKCWGVIDHGTFSEASVDYPDFARLVATDIQKQRATFGILACTTGEGMAICANRFRSIRAALIWTADGAELSRRHNDANILCLGSRWLRESSLRPILETFFCTPFEGGRHERRLQKLDEL